MGHLYIYLHLYWKFGNEIWTAFRGLRNAKPSEITPYINLESDVYYYQAEWFCFNEYESLHKVAYIERLYLKYMWFAKVTISTTKSSYKLF